ncbi:MAG TPA: 3-hydroxyacyl-ACP dehydratase FabZ family protein [Pirellula sp.]|nr:3-hydroxyacyl-ACP dehydratase FabZ family protein [Pirellula sp.]
MRWFWIDRFIEFVRDARATTVKNVSFGEEPIDDYLPGHPHYPHSLIIEGMAQTGGLLVSEAEGFQTKTVLAKVSKAIFHQLIVPGDQIFLTAVVQDKKPSGAIVEGTVKVNGQVRAELELSFAFLDDRFGATGLFPPEDLLRTLRILKLFDVAVDQNGNRIHPPEHMLEAERQAAREFVLSRAVVQSKPNGL